MLDIFSSDAFGVVSLTTAINKLPYKPGLLGQMGLFTKKGITTTSVAIEEQSGKLALIPTQPRGTMPKYQSARSRNLRSFVVPHIPYNDAVFADEVQNVRAFGSDDQVEAVTDKVNDKLETMRQSHEVTHEYHRIGAVQGKILDADGTSVIYDLFSEFGITEPTEDIDFATDTGVTESALAVVRALETALGAVTYQKIIAFCGAEFFDALVTSANVRDAYAAWKDGEMLRAGGSMRPGFQFGEIEWREYRGKIGSIDFFPTDECRFVPVGVTDLFMQYAAPANFIETVNTTGLEVYAKQQPMDFDIGVELHTQSNPLIICTRPGVLIKGTIAAGE